MRLNPVRMRGYAAKGQKKLQQCLFWGTINLAFSVKLIISRVVYYSALHQCSDFCYYFEAGYSGFCSTEQTEEGSTPSPLLKILPRKSLANDRLSVSVADIHECCCPRFVASRLRDGRLCSEV